ncbi:MAG: repair protein RecO [Shewanella sp.]|jgi:DNA repair protein RecO (recombination protein O)|uniref:DNA repair protein RecO n=1 Tax=Shewanella sp. 4t3-1-2LB TaxID=2817682 RepID=UPI001A99FC1A|nr:DNA repair protein RecO [Shewanella sp. 4t3-1-2LB]MBO1272083.1 DNA repair protein RecO [Shewanella sp. 4t3-1-2LB]MDN5369535.1 repair protein RecO [Shewanella sp.]
MYRGYVLHAKPYQENSALLKLLVDGLGRVDAVARLGSGKRSLKSIVQPFQPLLFALSGRSELRNLNQIETASPAVPLSGDALYSAIYLNELLVRALAQVQSGESLFVPYHQTLIALAREFSQTPLRFFELTLLEELGCMPSLTHDANGVALDAAQLYRWLPESGFLPGDGVFPGRVLLALAARELDAADWSYAKRLTRVLLQPVVGERPLLSRQLFSNRALPKNQE